MIRLLIFIALFLLLYWALRKAASRSSSPPPPRRDHREELVDELVQDPVCGVYHPKRQAFRLEHRGKVRYFCSKNCMEIYKQGGAGGQGS